MATVRIGRYPNTSGPDLAIAYGGQQAATQTIGYATQTVTLTTVTGWVGNYSGSPAFRFVLFWDHSDGRPGGVAGYTNEMTASVGYTGAGGGQRKTGTLISPVVVPANHRLWVGVAVRNGDLGIAQIASGDITEPNESLYRKNISGSTPVDGVGSTVQASVGQLMIAADGTTGATGEGGTGAPGNSIPFAPEIITVGSLTPGDLSPTLQLRHRDPDGNNSSKARIEVRQVGQTDLKWEWEGAVAVANNAIISRTYAGTALAYSTSYEWRAQTWDSNGNEGPFSGWESFVIHQANVAPTVVSLSPDLAVGATIARTSADIGNLKPVFHIVHSDSNNDYARKARIELRLKGGAELWDYQWNTGIPPGSNISIQYSGSAGLSYYTAYEWRAYVSDGTAWSLPSAWAEFQIAHSNQPPAAPVPVAPFPEDADVPSDITQFKWVFNDPDADLPGMATWERTDAVRVIVRNLTDNTEHWNSGWVATAHSNGATITLSYTGPALLYNKRYQFIYNHRDRRLAASGATAGYKTFEPVGAITQPTTPSGRQTNYADPGTITATFVEPGGASTTHIQVGLFNDQDQIVAYTDLIAKVVAPGATFTHAWTSLGTWLKGDGTLPPGLYRYLKIRAKYGAQGLLTEWSPGQLIWGNAAPGVPEPYLPEHEFATATKPILVVLADDADQASTALTVTFEVATEPTFASPVLTANGTRTAGGTGVGARGRFERDLSTASLVLDTTYYWRAYSYDGVLYSGVATTAGTATRSTPRSFTYANVPAVTITSPTTIATMSPTITWTSSQAQLKYQVILRDTDNVIVYDSGEIESTTLQHTITDAYWLNGNRWNNNETLNVTVSSWNALKGTSPTVAVTLVYAYPDTLTTVTATPVTPQGHVGTTVIEIAHDPTAYAEGVFSEYRYYRSELTGEGGEVVPGTRVLIATNASPANPIFRDWEIRSRQWYRYEAVQATLSGVDEIESLPWAVDAMAQWNGIVIHLPYQPDMYNVHFRWSAPGGSFEPQRSVGHRTTDIDGINNITRIAAVGRIQNVIVEGVFSVFDDDEAGVLGADMVDRIDALMDCAAGIDSPDGRPHIVAWRSGRGGRKSITYGTFSGNTGIQPYDEFDDEWIVSVEVREALFVLGEEA